MIPHRLIFIRKYITQNLKLVLNVLENNKLYREPSKVLTSLLKLRSFTIVVLLSLF